LKKRRAWEERKGKCAAVFRYSSQSEKKKEGDVEKRGGGKGNHGLYTLVSPGARKTKGKRKSGHKNLCRSGERGRDTVKKEEKGSFDLVHMPIKKSRGKGKGTVGFNDLAVGKERGGEGDNEKRENRSPNYLGPSRTR